LSQPQPKVTLSQDEIDSLMKRSRDLIAAGDVASARLVLTHLADAGVAQASFVLACTFDSSVLENLKVVGVKADPAKALAWYSRAAEQGSLEAKQHLQVLR
jgi:TPR repeat protein